MKIPGYARLLGALALAGCFPTLQSARINPGLHLAAGSAVLTDQQREGKPQGADIVAFVSPSYGFAGPGIEIGLPVAVYLEEGLASLRSDALSRYGTSPRSLLVAPYVKLGFNQTHRDKFAVLGQTVWLLPSSLTVIYSRDYGRWTPYTSLKYVFSSGPAGDDPFITRYQEGGQSIWVAALGVEYQGGPRPALEFGLMRNSYLEGTVYAGPATGRRTLYDVFVGFRVAR